jgi:hypothetical protein
VNLNSQNEPHTTRYPVILLALLVVNCWKIEHWSLIVNLEQADLARVSGWQLEEMRL